MTTLLDLPDELLIEIALHLPPAPGPLLQLGEVSQRLHSITQAPILWVRLFAAQADFKLDPSAARRIVAAAQAPGYWSGKGRDWVSTDLPECQAWSLWPSNWMALIRRVLGSDSAASEDPPDPTASHSEPAEQPEGRVREGQIPVHWPTLYRSRLLIRAERNARGPHAFYSAARELVQPEEDEADAIDAGDSLLVWPHYVWLLREHTAKIYACAVRGPWLITGARDKHVNIYRLPALPLDGRMPAYGPHLALREQVHASSVIHLDFVLDGEAGEAGERSEPSLSVGQSGGGGGGAGERTGLLVTSATEVVRTFDVTWGHAQGDAWAGTALAPRATLLGAEAPVSDVQIHGPWIVVMYVNGLCRVYARESRGDAIPIRTVYGGDSCHLLALGPGGSGRALLAGDERGVLFDLHGGRELARFALSISGRVASVAWSGDHIALGTGNGTVELYDRRGAHVLVIKGTGHLVRHVLLDPANDTVITAGYEGHVQFWNLSDGVLRRAYDLQAGPIFGLAREGMHLVVTTSDRVVVVTYGVGLPYAGLFA